MPKQKISEHDADTLYAALRLIENLYKQGRVKKCVFRNIIKECSEKIDITPFQCYT